MTSESALIEGVQPGMAHDPALVEMREAVAEERLSNTERESIMAGLRDTKNLSESTIAPDVLEQLLPDEYIELPKVSHIAGGLGYRFVKRTFDLVSCSVALVVLAVPMLVIAIRIKNESPGPVFYTQTREGKDGKPYKLVKFRSMYTDAEVRGAQWALNDDPRITPLGKKLRNSRLDEIPQFWNVVKGDMSLVGPRPERPAFCREFEKRINGWSQRTLVRPGITGLAQVEGGYELLPKEKARLDIKYIESRNIALDLKIMLRTLGVLKTGDGAR